jgi:ubiquinone/menaquinone biosynthesis C-methylase UbiE
MANNQSGDGGFDFIAPFYDPLSRLIFGNNLRKAQSFWLEQIPQGADILVFGGGSGWLLNRILAVCKPRHVIYIDASPVMISLARKEVKNDNRVDFRIGSETALLSSDHFDVIVTPFILDLFTNEQLKAILLPRLFRGLRTNGFWLCCDFVEPTTWWQRVLLWSQYRFFRTFSHIMVDQLPDWMRLLNSIPDLNQPQTASFFGGMIVSGIWRKVND